MKTAWIGLLAGTLAVSAGCKENATATAACSTQAGKASCETCCKGNGANGYKFASGACTCLGGKEKAALAPATPPPPVAAAPQPVQPVQQPAAPVGVNAGAFSIPKTVFTRGEPVVVTYLRDMTTPAGQQHWITLVKPTDVESAWGAWHYVPQSARSDVLNPPTPGEWEIRLHDIYPRWASRVIARQRITVQ